MMREKSYWVVDCRVGDADRWDGGWFQFHAGSNRRYARKMFAQAKLSYSHWARLSIRLRRWVRPTGTGVHGWMSERRP